MGDWKRQVRMSLSSKNEDPLPCNQGVKYYHRSQSLRLKNQAPLLEKWDWTTENASIGSTWKIRRVQKKCSCTYIPPKKPTKHEYRVGRGYIIQNIEMLKLMAVKWPLNNIKRLDFTTSPLHNHSTSETNPLSNISFNRMSLPEIVSFGKEAAGFQWVVHSLNVAIKENSINPADKLVEPATLSLKKKKMLSFLWKGASDTLPSSVFATLTASGCII